MKKQMTQQQLRVQTQVRAGNLASDKCYAERNWRTIDCTWNGGWRNQILADCRGTNNEAILKKCLSKSGEPNWWKDFEGCTSATQCLTINPADYVLS